MDLAPFEPVPQRNKEAELLRQKASRINYMNVVELNSYYDSDIQYFYQKVSNRIFGFAKDSAVPHAVDSNIDVSIRSLRPMNIKNGQ